MKVKILFWSLAIAIGLGVTASAQSDSKLKVPTTTPKQDAGNPAKLPPTVKQLFIPDLRLKGADSVAVDATVPKSYFKVVFTFQNWSDFPPEMSSVTWRKVPTMRCKRRRFINSQSLTISAFTIFIRTNPMKQTPRRLMDGPGKASPFMSHRSKCPGPFHSTGSTNQ